MVHTPILGKTWTSNMNKGHKDQGGGAHSQFAKKREKRIFKATQQYCSEGSPVGRKGKKGDVNQTGNWGAMAVREGDRE